MSKRYFLIKLVSEEPISREDFARALTDVVRKYYGEIGLAHTNPRLIRFDSQRSEAIVACNGDESDKLQTAIALLSDVSDINVAPLILRLSGTIRSLTKK